MVQVLEAFFSDFDEHDAVLCCVILGLGQKEDIRKAKNGRVPFESLALRKKPFRHIIRLHDAREIREKKYVNQVLLRTVRRSGLQRSGRQSKVRTE